MSKFIKTFLVSSLVFLSISFAAQGQTVYASEKGEKYHTADCRLSGDANAMRLATAKKNGKNGCSVCKPDEHFKDKVVQCNGKTADGTRCKRMTASKEGKCYQHIATKK